jgi:multidrug efflux pump subunit AcrA (membrane-fusion protein)
MKTVLGGFIASLLLAASIPILVYTYVDVYAQADADGATLLARGGTYEEHVVDIDPVAQQHITLRTELPVETRLTPEIRGYGRIEADPAAVFTVRAPMTGVLEASEGGTWPNLGETIEDGTVVGLVRARLAGIDRVDLSTRLAQAKANAQEARASLSASRASLERAKVLNAEDKNVSDKALDEISAKVRGDESRLRAAEEQAKLITDALTADPNSAAVLPVLLVATQGGEVVELLANPGETIQAGQPIMRLTRFDQLIARIHLLAGDAIDDRLKTARLAVVGREEIELEGERIAIAESDRQTGARSYLFRINASGLDLRPGLAITAALPVPGEERAGVIIPRAAVVRHGGQAWVYVQSGDRKFTRKAVNLERGTPDGWFTTDTIVSKEDERVVVTGAQALLSEELKSLVEEYAG